MGQLQQSLQPFAPFISIIVKVADTKQGQQA